MSVKLKVIRLGMMMTVMMIMDLFDEICWFYEESL
jgi:hypothetical protein